MSQHDEIWRVNCPLPPLSPAELYESMMITRRQENLDRIALLTERLKSPIDLSKYGARSFGFGTWVQTMRDAVSFTVGKGCRIKPVYRWVAFG